MTVTEYAKKHGISKQAVYDKLNRGTLQYKTIKGVKHIILNDELKTLNKTTLKPLKTVSKKKYKKTLKLLNKSIQDFKESKQKIKSLKNTIEYTNKLLEAKQSEIETLNKSLGALILLVDKSNPKEIVYDTKVKKKRKNKH